MEASVGTLVNSVLVRRSSCVGVFFAPPWEVERFAGALLEGSDIVSNARSAKRQRVRRTAIVVSENRRMEVRRNGTTTARSAAALAHAGGYVAGLQTFRVLARRRIDKVARHRRSPCPQQRTDTSQQCGWPGVSAQRLPRHVHAKSRDLQGLGRGYMWHLWRS
jgi:hypothetical protein